jgi:ligand-binding sensor domain-containing protein
MQVYQEATSPPSAFVEDRAGDVWIGLWDHAVLRYRNGRFDRFTAASGIPEGSVHDLLIDHKGRLWLALTTGLSRVDAPAS